MQTSADMDILRGHSRELPEVRSKTVRIFISSTFSDTLSERDSLIDSVFPKLKDYCREKYGLEFQYSDMRWGIQNESADNHSEVATCLNEVALCQKYSVATNFVVLLSHRYGSRPTPATIHATLFEQLQEIIRSDSKLIEDAELLSQWYRIDTNSIPASYILQPISSILPNMKSNNVDEMKQAAKQWTKINNRIRTCLRQAAARCFALGHITSDEYDNFFISVTEKEIVKGVLSAPNVNQRTLCFLREIEDIQNHLSDKNASKYIDICHSDDGGIVVDEEAEQLLNNLKYTRIPKVLQSKNIYSYKMSWNKNGINRQDHADYITKFNDDFYNAIKEQIDACAKLRVTMASDSLLHEVMEHAIQCKAYITKFHGRIDVLQKLERYIKDNKESRPCIVYGESGCGKTSIIAKTAMEALNWWSDRSSSVILRFLGTTPISSTVYKTMMSISRHICKLYNLSMQSYLDTMQLRYQLENELLPRIPDDEYLIILLDSIDQLESDAYDCRWLPSVFPKNVKCIVSAIPNHGNILKHFKEILNLDLSESNAEEQLLVHVPPFDSSTVDIVYSDWLARKQRSLSEEQRFFIQELMQEQIEILPLYMKLVFDIILNWHSYDPIDVELRKLKTVNDCIRYLFEQLKIVHNSVLFSRALCYMTACRNGISQNELEDVLSLDDDVLRSVFQHYIPPIRRVPGILWTRIRNDLDEYITEKEADDSTVIYWYHRRFIEVAISEYIAPMNSAERAAVFQNMVDLFKETWKGKSKPFTVTDAKLVNKYKLTESNGEIEANRFITSQPIEFVDAHGHIQFNKRKLNELPQFLSQITLDLAAPIAAQEMFFNYSFMRAKVVCSTFKDIMSDVRKFTHESPYHMPKEIQDAIYEIDVFALLYMIIGAPVEDYPDNFPFEVTSRLLCYHGTKPYMSGLIEQLDRESPQYCSLIVPYQQLQPPGSSLIYTMNRHKTSIAEFRFENDQLTLITLSDRIVVLDMTIMNSVIDIKLPNIDEPYINSVVLYNAYGFNQKEQTTIDWLLFDRNEQYRRYYFLVNSSHRIYLVSANGSIKFERWSKSGYLAVNIVHKRCALGIIVEKNSNSVECWNIVQNQLFDRVEFPKLTIRNVLCVELYGLVIIVLQDGTIHIYSVANSTKSSLAHRGTIKVDCHIDLVVAEDEMLIVTFDAKTSIDLAFVGLKQFTQVEETLRDDQVCKALVTFDPPIEPKPIKSIVLPDKEIIVPMKVILRQPLFVAKTDDSVFVIHKCVDHDISYIRINGRFDVVSIHARNPELLYTARGGTVDLHVWMCFTQENSNEVNHEYQLLVSIDISSSPVTAIRPSAERVSLFYCSLESGVIQAYYGALARITYEQVPSRPRANEIIRIIKLLGKKAVTLDDSKRELTTWSYQHSSLMKSTRFFQDNITVREFALVSSLLRSRTVFVLILTNNHWIEIYSSKVLQDEPIFSVRLGSAARIHSTLSGVFYVITTDGFVFSLVQQVLPDQSIQFKQTTRFQLQMRCSMMFSSALTINGIECLAVLADNAKSMAIYINERLVYVNIINPPSKVESITSDPTRNVLLLFFNDTSLISSEISLNESNENGSVILMPLGKADKFCLKNNCLATYNNRLAELNLYDVNIRQCLAPIRLENECQELCLNDSAAYVFALVKPRMLYMYRIHDRRQMAKLFIYDYVTYITADHEFLVLAMNDRRLLTLMIADPDDPTLQARIKALPSRDVNCIDNSTASILDNMKKRACMDSSDDDDEVSSEKKSGEANRQSTNKKDSEKTAVTSIRPESYLRFVSQLNIRCKRSSRRTTQEIRSVFMENYANGFKATDLSSMINNSDIENDDDYDVVSSNNTLKREPQERIDNDLEDIRKKALECNQNQLSGIQFANVGNHIKVVNSYAITSQTCSVA